MYNRIFLIPFQINSDPQLRKKIFQYHLVSRSGGKRYQQIDQMHPPVMKFDKDGYWSDVLKRQFVFTRGNVTCNTYLMIETFDDPKHKQVGMKELITKKNESITDTKNFNMIRHNFHYLFLSILNS